MCNIQQNIRKDLKIDGFTMLEVLVVISILGILASVALPSYESYVQRAKVGAAIEFLAGYQTGATGEMMTRGEANYQPPSSAPMEFLQCVTVDIRRTNRRSDCNQVFITAWPNEKFDSSVNLGTTRMLELFGTLNSAGAVDWLCGPFARNNRNIDSSLLPASCQDVLPIARGRSCLTGSERSLAVQCRRDRGGGGQGQGQGQGRGNAR